MEDGGQNFQERISIFTSTKGNDIMSTETTKKQIGMGRGMGKPGLPSNIQEFISRDGRHEQGLAAKKFNKWLYGEVRRNVCGGTAIGKNYSTLILDVTYQGSEVYINEDGQIKFCNEVIKSKKDFEKVLNENFEVTNP